MNYLATDRNANYEIVKRTKALVALRDVGPWDKYLTITNAAEEVVNELFKLGKLAIGQRLIYYDSSGNLDEIIIEHCKFRGFKPYRP